VPPEGASAAPGVRLDLLDRRLLFVTGKGGVGKTTVASSLALLAAGAATASAGTVYTETNSAGANAVQIFQSASDGSLSLAATVSTGGLGTGAGLGNQGALALSGDDRYLYAVNAGSNEISAFTVSDAGLTLVDRVPSGGTHPISVTTHGRLVYVLNSGDSGNISGFHVGPDGHLRPISGSSRPLSSATAGPAEVSFSPDGSTLVVTEKALNQFAIYTVEDDVPSAPVTRASSRTALSPRRSSWHVARQ